MLPFPIMYHTIARVLHELEEVMHVCSILRFILLFSNIFYCLLFSDKSVNDLDEMLAKIPLVLHRFTPITTDRCASMVTRMWSPSPAVFLTLIGNFIGTKPTPPQYVNQICFLVIIVLQWLKLS